MIGKARYLMTSDRDPAGSTAEDCLSEPDLGKAMSSGLLLLPYQLCHPNQGSYSKEGHSVGAKGLELRFRSNACIQLANHATDVSYKADATGLTLLTSCQWLTACCTTMH